MHYRYFGDKSHNGANKLINSRLHDLKDFEFICYFCVTWESIVSHGFHDRLNVKIFHAITVHEVLHITNELRVIHVCVLKMLSSK